MPVPIPMPSARVQAAPFEALVFDLDNTLVDAEAAYVHALHAIGISPHGAAFRQARHTVKQRLGPGHVCGHNRLLYFKALLEAQANLGPRNLLLLMQAYEQQLGLHIHNQWVWLCRRGLLQTLRGACGSGPMARQRRRRCMLLTNENTRTQLLKWQAMDPLAELFDGIITSEELGHEKPHASLFVEVVRRLQTPAEACLMVGDDMQADILPALSCGMAAIWTQEFCRRRPPKLLPGATQVERLDDLLGLWKW